MSRTSLTHPLQIDELACGAGVIGMTFCPGKKGESLYGGIWDRDLEVDIKAMETWGANIVVTLMEAHEFALLGIPEACEAFANMGPEWLHLPIVDVSTPDETFERRWIYFGHRLRGVLRRGGKVLIHCRGGLGRTGTIAARLLVEFGVSPGEAMRAVRAARSGTIETPRQEAWVRDLSPLPLDDARADKLLGCLLGGAVGDAFGYAVEFQRLSEIRRRHGPEGLREPVLHQGRLVASDDTQMTLFTAEGLVRSVGAGKVVDNDIVAAIREAYVAWNETQTRARPDDARYDDLRAFPSLWALRHPGTTCLSAMAAGGRGTVGSPINDSKGCGGVMRTAPIGLVRGVTADRAFSLASRAAALTHGHPSGYLSAGALASMICDLISGVHLPESLERTRARLRRHPPHEETLTALDNAVADSRSPGTPNVIPADLGGGWVGEEALAIAVYAALTAVDFRDLLRIASNHDGDSDSTASIAGQIWGAHHGVAAIPVAWVSRLDLLDPLCEMAKGLLALDLTSHP